MLTPNQIAKRYRTRYATVIHWIKSGKLRAINTSTKGTRYKIRPEWLTDLDEKLTVAPQAPVARRKREPSFVRWV